ncbi:MAG: cytochrome P450 [Alphaproteobacteria bacterium]|nr:cytochrome P450 [Alphaproteobacteria bacterium]
MSFLETFDGTADPAARTALFFGAVQADWRSLFAELRETRPILDLPVMTVVTRWADVVDMLSRNETFRVTYAPHMDPSVGPFMLGRDGAIENWRDKAAMRTLLRWDDLPGIRATAAEVASTALRAATQGPSGVFDVVATVSRLVPLKIVQRCFGFPGPDDATMLAWSRATQADMFHNLTNDPAILQANIAAGQAMQAWVAQFVDGRQPWATAAGEDTVSRLLRLTGAGLSGLDRQGVISNVCGLLVGAIETASQAIANATAQILLNPTQAGLATQAAQKGDNATFDAIVWEALRFAPMTTFVLRVAAEPAVLAPGTDHQATVPAGRVVAAGIGSAMFDPAVFPGPDDFQTRPRDLYLHVGFGAHICLGQYVAYEIIPETIRQVLLVPGVHLLPQDGSAINNAGGPFAESFKLGFKAA